ncbi:hypothetical protein Q5P01_000626 [Channa striata]|uniref:Reverse transcriptase domain-containing protein n=1 Tax=Channa striata TaxID=64152 RepID=A0AA88IH61_CHASR|nr:hypothetical protein Q5P01_000626 [Channa striata]
MGYHDDDRGWTTVTYGRRRGPPQQRPWDRGERAHQRMDSARPVFFRRQAQFPFPNQPVPPAVRWTRLPGPPQRTYASVVSQNIPASAPRWFASGVRGQSLNLDQRTQQTDPAFGRLVRKLHSVIKLVHHLQNVTPTPGKAEPRMIARMVDILSNMIKPASPSAATGDLIVGNAKNWGYNTLLILEEHYKESLDRVLADLSKQLTKDWKTAFLVATKWARRNLPKVTQVVIDHAEALITSCMAEQEQGDVVPESQPTPLSAPAQPVQPQVHTSQEAAQTRTAASQPTGTCSVATNTERVSGLLPGGAGDVGKEDIPPILQQGPPKEQRPERRGLGTNACVVAEDSLLECIQEEGEEPPISQASFRGRRASSDLAFLEDNQDAGQDNTATLTPIIVPAVPKRVHTGAQSVAAQVHRDESREDDIIPTPEQNIVRVKKHIRTDRKMVEWGLSVSKKAQNAKQTAVKQIQAALRQAKKEFPHSEIWIPLINFSSSLPRKEQETLKIINAHIHKNMPCLPQLKEEDFHTEKDNVHWTAETAKAMLLHWEGNEGTQPRMSQNVIVLAENFKLSKAQFDLLNRGLTFIPTLDIHKDQKGRLQFDIQEYHRKIQLAVYFQNKKREKLPFLSKSGWVPPREKLPPQITELIDRDNYTFKQYFRSYREKPNLSQEEVKALRELMRNRHIVIKPADKGSVVVILSRQQYIAEVSRQLQDNMYYKKLEEPIYLETVPMVHDILDKLKRKKFITGNQNKYLKGEIEPRSRRFYILPKIHKAPEKWTVPYRIPPGRPIVSDCDSETYRTAEYVDYFLNPLSVKHTSYVKDTYHFIDIMKNLSVPPDSLFFTIDIDSLYTNIDTTAGLAAVQRVFQKYPDKRRPDKQILELLEINLNRNDFEFNGDFYLQIKGTAMGKKFAPAYANIFMANWEEEALAKCPIKPLHYLRYLDDIWGIWTGTMEQFEGFIHILNTHDPSIKLKYNKHQQCIDFLDTTVYKGQLHSQTHKLDIKVYFKETDTHALLFKTSFHPQHTYRGLIKSQLIRFWRICTQEEDFRGAVTILFAALRKSHLFTNNL